MAASAAQNSGNSSDKASTATQGSSDQSAATGGTSTKKESGDAQKLTQGERDFLLSELRFQTAVHMEAVEAMMDGAVLGAEQVQDKRLEFLEAGSTTDTTQGILMFVAVLILEGTVGPLIASIAVAGFLRLLARNSSRAISLRQEHVKVNKKIAELLVNKKLLDLHAGGVNSLVDPLNETVNDLKKGLQKYDRRQTQLMQQRVNELTDKVSANVIATAKATLAVEGGISSTPRSRNKGSSPGVSVQTAAMISASKFRILFVTNHRSNEQELRRNDITTREALDILEKYKAEDPIDLTSIREYFQLATEAMIWARLLIDDETRDFVKKNKNNRIMPGDRGMPRLPLPRAMDDKHLKYLEIRFGEDIERFQLENDPEPLPDTRSDIEIRFDKQRRALEKRDWLIRYLSAVSEATPEFKLKK